MGVLDRIKPKAELVDFHDQDVQVLRSWVEYTKDRQTMQYLMYEMEVRDHNGEPRHFYKAIKLFRTIRLPKDAKQETKFMESMSQVLSGLYTRGVNWLVLMANMIHPVPLGLLHCYGVQATSDDIDEAKRFAENDFAALQASIQGTFRVMEFRVLNYDEVEWLREKMFGMKHLTVVRGIPEARRSAAEGTRVGWGQDSAPGAEGTAEDFVAGMSSREYVLVAIASSVKQDTLNNWRAQTAKDMTFWNGLKQGTRSISAGVSMPFIFASNLGSNSGWTHQDTSQHGISHSTGEAFSHSVGEGTSQSSSVGQSVGSNVGENVGQSIGSSHTFGQSATVSHSHGESIGHTVGESFGTTDSVSNSQSTSVGQSVQHSQTMTHGSTVGTSQTQTMSATSTSGHSHADTSSSSTGHSLTGTDGTSASQSQSRSHADGQSGSISIGSKQGIGVVGISETGTVGMSSTDSQGTGSSFGQNHSLSAGQSDSTSNGFSDSSTASQSQGFSRANGETQSQSTSVANGESMGTTITGSTGVTSSHGTTQTQSYSASQTDSNTDTYGQGISSSVGSTNTQSQGQSYGLSQGQSSSQSVGSTTSVSDGTTKSTSDGSTSSVGTSQGTTGGVMQGTSASGGLGPSISFGKSYQWVDQEVTQILQLLEYQSNRLMLALSGQGAFFVDMMIATPDEQTKAAAQSLARTAWVNEKAYVTPLEVMDLSQEEESHLLYHFNAFSPCNARETYGEVTSYRYSTVLLANEAVAYSHPLRISEGGIFADVESVPILAVPSMRPGPIYIGKIVSGERWTPTMGYKTPFDFRLEGDELMHGLWAGESRSGKTEAALRFAAEVANKVKTKDGKRWRILALDPKKDWRRLGRFVSPDRFRFYSLANTDMNPIRLNLCKIPKGVFPQFYLDALVEVYCRAYQLNERGREILTDALSHLYEEEGVFVDNWKDVAPDRSARVSMTRMYERVRQMKVDLEDPSKGFGKAGNADREALGRVLERLKVFSRKYTIESQLFGQATDMGVDDLLGDDDVVVLESYGLEGTFRNFVFGLVTSSIFQYAQGCPNGFYSPNQYPTLLMIEEANEVLLGQGGGAQQVGLPGVSQFEKILDQSAGLGLLVHSITQKPFDMPASVIANSGLLFAGKLSRKEDLETIVLKLGRDPRRQDIELLKWFPRSPIGWLVCRSSRNFDFKQIEPSIVAVDRLDVSNPSDDELKAILQEASLMKGISNAS